MKGAIEVQSIQSAADLPQIGRVLPPDMDLESTGKPTERNGCSKSCCRLISCLVYAYALLEVTTSTGMEHQPTDCALLELASVPTGLPAQVRCHQCSLINRKQKQVDSP